MANMSSNERLPDVATLHAKKNSVLRRLGEWLQYWAPSFLLGLIFVVIRRKRRAELEGTRPRILVMLIEHIGDIVVSTPLLKALRAAQPEAHISVVASSGAGALIAHSPYIDEYLSVDSALGWWLQIKRALTLSKKLRAKNYDFALVPKDAHNRDFNELTCMLAGCRHRISRSRPQLAYRLKPLKFFPFYDRIIINTKPQHEIYQRLTLARAMGFEGAAPAPEIWLTEDDHAFAESFFDNLALEPHSRPVALGVGASAGGRCWPLSNYAAVTDRLAQDFNLVPILIISPDELRSAVEISNMSRVRVHFSSTATVRQSAALMSLCSLFVGNDSGPMHIAAALGLPVVEISAHPRGATSWSISSPNRFGPYGVSNRILRPIAIHAACKNGCISTYAPHCITQISVEEVISAARSLVEINSNGNGRSSCHML